MILYHGSYLAVEKPDIAFSRHIKRGTRMIANKYLLQRKYPRIIARFADRRCVSLRDAMDAFYSSLTYREMSEGISDMHCRSDEYLVEELCREMDGAE
ncbi:MAG: DUF3990 domain-containing protein [Synergistaceae bacterium]|jgi:hypothetical protein|nr:DUF3990 domain-containing protein [Synergistaceae bacterium]